MQLSAITSVAGSPTSYADTVVADGPSHYYRLGETSGTMAADSSGNGRHATYQGHGLFEPWIAGKHVQLGKPGALAVDADPGIYLPDLAVKYYDEARVFGELGSHAGLATANGPRTVEGWVKTTSGSFLVAVWGSAATNQRFAVHVRGTTVVVDRGGGALTLPADRVLNDGAWHQVVVSFDGANAVLFVDGQRRSSAALGPLGTVATAPTVGFVNRSVGVGFVDEVALYPKTLTDRQVHDHYEASTTLAPAGRSRGSRS